MKISVKTISFEKILSLSLLSQPLVASKDMRSIQESCKKDKRRHLLSLFLVYLSSQCDEIHSLTRVVIYVISQKPIFIFNMKMQKVQIQFFLKVNKAN